MQSNQPIQTLVTRDLIKRAKELREKGLEAVSTSNSDKIRWHGLNLIEQATRLEAEIRATGHKPEMPPREGEKLMPVRLAPLPTEEEIRRARSHYGKEEKRKEMPAQLSFL